MPRPLGDNVKIDDGTMDVNAEVNSNCAPNIMAITDSCANEGQPRTAGAVDMVNSDYAHDDGGNAQRTHRHDEQVSSQTTTYTKRDKYTKQLFPNSAGDTKYSVGYDDTEKQPNVSPANNKWKPTTAV